MEPFRNLTGIVVPLDRANVDTDAIMPKQFLKAIGRTGFGPNLFDEWRYLDRGEPGQDCSRRPLNPDFVLNDARYRGARVFLARDNFGCGSSREHAVWALLDYGIRCVIAPSFAEIFYSNCCKNGLLAIRLPAETMDRLFSEVLSKPGYALTIDLAGQTVAMPDGQLLHFEIDAGIKQRLLLGLDDIAMTMQSTDDIRHFEVRRRAEAAWLFPE
jgi:3-isopropylmalate/(R)-2-methylmalate dehydratase small subunit